MATVPRADMSRHFYGSDLKNPRAWRLQVPAMRSMRVTFPSLGAVFTSIFTVLIMRTCFMRVLVFLDTFQTRHTAIIEI